jgi:hypothetical protein
MVCGPLKRWVCGAATDSGNMDSIEKVNSRCWSRLKHFGEQVWPAKLAAGRKLAIAVLDGNGGAKATELTERCFARRLMLTGAADQE